MDAATAERINNLAKNLHELHLASSMDDAFQKAREIILGSDSSGKSLNAMHEEEVLLKEAQSIVKEEAEEIAQVHHAVEAIEEFKDAVDHDQDNSLELTKESTHVSEQLKKDQEELARIRQEIEVAKLALTEAKRVSDQAVRHIPNPIMSQAVEQQEQMPVQQEQAPAPKPRPTLTEEEKKKSNLANMFNFGRR
ncbi:MAG: hypothetical protein AABY01_01690 [Nanoarchaeota archaeon]